MSNEQVLNSDPENNYQNNFECFKDAICINANRVYDSCSDKDCIENLPIYFPDSSQPLINRAINIKIKSIDVIHTNLDVERVPFNQGFFSVDITFYFKIKLSVIEPSICHPTLVDGLAMFSKKVILYGSEGNIKTFSSNSSNTQDFNNNYYNKFDIDSSLPQATIQISKPISLSTQLINLQNNCCLPEEKQFNIPKCIENLFDGEFCCAPPEKIIYITIGIFSIIQLERKTQIMIPIYDFCVPNKECDCSTDSPCELFKKIKFPTNEFFPPSLEENSEFCE
ncbi:MAG: hypothetical protein J6C55_04195 [Oscillospiraceae bacterium]|nr:hypothetical protein [Oscillospiraceae bacterium]